QPGDMADQILDLELHPEWAGERMRMVESFPTNEKLWDEYAEIYRQGLRARDIKKATSFYRKHRKAMDEGSAVSWPQRHFANELSGIQHAMNWRIKDENSFWAEFQNEPIPDEDLIEGALDADQVMAKINNRPRGQVPAGCSTITAFIDCGQKILFWAVCAWQEDFTGYVIDYGTYPDQNRLHFSTRNVGRTLARVHQGMGVEGALYASLRACVTDLVTRDWKREDGALMRADLILVDQGWKTDTVHQLCRESSHGASLLPARGSGITASQRPINEYSRARGDRIGHNWWVPSVKGKRVLRHLEVDTNYWKTFVHDRLGTAQGDPGCLSLFGKRPAIHRMIAEHVVSEYRVRTEGRGRTVDEWKLPPAKPDNHWFDCLVGCAVAANFRGITMTGAPGPARAGRKINLREWQERGRRARQTAKAGRR
ncbi:MAG TPA: terminase gpA endonuclease subunit, partial [Phycisphaerae bacterium]|nr:terminase gpA endonuclease subunit [Phycisphaerae bacterium]